MAAYILQARLIVKFSLKSQDFIYTSLCHIYLLYLETTI